MNASRWRLIGSIVALVLLLGGSFQLDYLRVLLADRDAVARRIDHLRFGKMPEIRGYLEAVEAKTSRGESVALLIPAPGWNQGYEYAFYRAAYVLAGRTVLPVMTPAGDPIPGNLERADLIAAWRVPLDPSRFEIVWRGHDGVLARVK